MKYDEIYREALAELSWHEAVVPERFEPEQKRKPGTILPGQFAEPEAVSTVIAGVARNRGRYKMDWEWRNILSINYWIIFSAVFTLASLYFIYFKFMVLF